MISAPKMTANEIHLVINNTISHFDYTSQEISFVFTTKGLFDTNLLFTLLSRKSHKESIAVILYKQNPSPDISPLSGIILGLGNPDWIRDTQFLRPSEIHCAGRNASKNVVFHGKANIFFCVCFTLFCSYMCSSKWNHAIVKLSSNECMFIVQKTKGYSEELNLHIYGSVHN